MGFFSDLKEDLSQAVSELMPEEKLDAALANKDNALLKSVLDEKSEEIVAETNVDENGGNEEQIEDTVSLSDLLDKVESIDLDAYEAEQSKETEKDAFELQNIFSLMEDANETTEYSEQVNEEVIVEEEAVQDEPMVDVLEEAIEKVEDSQATEARLEEIRLEDTIAQSSTSYYVENKEEERESRMATDETAVITAGMSINGDITTEGSLDLIGGVTGNVEVMGKLNITGAIEGNSKAAEIYAEGANIVGEVNSQGSVKVGQSTVIVGNIFATSAVIAGAVKGDIDVKGPVILDTSAIVMGNIKSKSVQINNGAVIEGMCSQCYADVNPISFFDELKTVSANKKSKK